MENTNKTKMMQAVPSELKLNRKQRKALRYRRQLDKGISIEKIAYHQGVAVDVVQAGLDLCSHDNATLYDWATIRAQRVA